MRQRTRSPLPSLVLISVLIAGSLGIPALAASDAREASAAHAEGMLRPAWLQTLLSWIDRVLGENEQRPGHDRSLSEAVWAPEEPESSDEPGVGAHPQAGPQIDPNG